MGGHQRIEKEDNLKTKPCDDVARRQDVPSSRQD